MSKAQGRDEAGQGRGRWVAVGGIAAGLLSLSIVAVSVFTAWGVLDSRAGEFDLEGSPQVTAIVIEDPYEGGECSPPFVYVSLRLRAGSVERTVWKSSVSGSWDEDRLDERLASVGWIEPGWSLQVDGLYKAQRMFWLGTRFSPPVATATIHTVESEPTPLSDDLRQQLSRAGIPARVLSTLSQVRADGQDAENRAWVNPRADTVLVLGPTFATQGAVVSKGPIVILGKPRGAVASGSWIVAAEKADLWSATVEAERIYLGSKARAPHRGFGAPAETVPGI